MATNWRSLISSLPEVLAFGPYSVPRKSVFFATELSYCFVNLKPVLPGHVLVAPRRVVRRVQDMSAQEVSDLWRAAQLVGKVLHAAHPETDGLTFTIQDGPSAGQTVPHVHIHVMPRSMTDAFNIRRKNDEIYEAIDQGEKALAGEAIKVDAETSRERTREEMAEEAEQLRGFVDGLIA